MAYYITRHDAMTQAVGSMVALGTDAEGAAATAPLVPGGASKIAQLIVSLTNSIQDVADAGVNVILRVSGNGVLGGTHDIAVGGIKNTTTSTGGAKFNAPNVINCDIGVIPGNTVNLSASMLGVDVGTPELTVTLVFA